MLSIVNPSRRSTTLPFASRHSVCATTEVVSMSRPPKNKIRITSPGFRSIIPRKRKFLNGILSRARIPWQEPSALLWCQLRYEIPPHGWHLRLPHNAMYLRTCSHVGVVLVGFLRHQRSSSPPSRTIATVLGWLRHYTPRRFDVATIRKAERWDIELHRRFMRVRL